MSENKDRSTKLLFVQGGSRWKFDNDGGIYTDSNFNESIWDRYRNLCGTLTVMLRREEKIYDAQEAQSRFNRFDDSKSEYVSLQDLYRPVRNALNPSIRRKIKAEIKRQVENADKVIIRSLGNIYTNTTLKYCRKYHKPYMVEVTGFAFESLWYHSFRGKIVALFNELQYRRLMRDVPYASYVTQEALQKHYPCADKMLGCSDVELPVLDDEILDRRLKKIKAQQDRIVIGTAAFLNVRWKGQEYVIRALGKLKEEGYDQFEYQMIGAGSGERLLWIAEKCGVTDQVKIIGVLPHERVFEWLDSIDIYAQPSFQEGLCRSLVEAMSRACPVACSDVGGNYELASTDCLFKKADYRQLAEILKSFIDKDRQQTEARRNFAKAKEFDKAYLDEKRDRFLREFVEG